MMITTFTTWGPGSLNVSHFMFCNHVCLVPIISSMLVWFQTGAHCTHRSLTALYPRMCINVHILSHLSFVLCLISSLLYQYDTVQLGSIKGALLFCARLNSLSLNGESATMDTDKQQSFSAVRVYWRLHTHVAHPHRPLTLISPE